MAFFSNSPCERIWLYFKFSDRCCWGNFHKIYKYKKYRKQTSFTNPLFTKYSHMDRTKKKKSMFLADRYVPSWLLSSTWADLLSQLGLALSVYEGSLCVCVLGSFVKDSEGINIGPDSCPSSWRENSFIHMVWANKLVVQEQENKVNRGGSRVSGNQFMWGK